MYRIIQWGTGNVGRHALRTIVERPDFTLAGVRVYDPAKVGADAGLLIGGPATGVLATDDPDEILGLDADCVCYTALGSTFENRDKPLDDICRILASGKNVVSSAVEHQAYLLPDFQLAGAGTNARERLTAACAHGGSTFFHVGINPGFAMDLWPITMTRLSRRIDRLTATEVVDMKTYTSSHMVRDIFGFGSPPGPTPLDKLIGDDVYESAYYLSIRQLADAIGFTVDEVRYTRETAVADTPFTIATGPVEAGTVAAMRFRFDGYHQGRVLVTLEFVWRVSDEVAPDWPTGDSRWLLSVEGDPTISSEFRLATTYDAGRAVSLAVATLLLNAVPVVCTAPPGLLNNLTLPQHGGGYLLPSAAQPAESIVR